MKYVAPEKAKRFFTAPEKASQSSRKPILAVHFADSARSARDLSGGP